MYPKCTRCGKWKVIAGFPEAERTSDGHQDWCFACYIEYNDSRSDKIGTYNQEYYKENRNQILQNGHNYYQEDREFRLQRAKGNFQKFKGTPEYHAYTARKNSRRRARHQAVENTLTAEECDLILALQGCCCVCCGCEFDPAPGRPRSLTWDHVITLSDSAGLTFENAQGLCLSCNTRKSTKTIDYCTWDPAETIRNVKRV